MTERELPSPLKNAIVICLENLTMDDVRHSGFSLPASLQDAHDSRKLSWLGGRLALAKAFSKMGYPIDLEDVIFVDHQQIASRPAFRFSISHTATAAGCWLIHDPSRAWRIGFDIEGSAREVSEKLAARMRNSNDLEVDDITLWSAKEAIFKCSDEDVQTQLSLKAIEVYAGGRFRIAGKAIRGFYETRIDNGLVISFAWR